MQDFEVKERLREHLEYLCSFDKLSGEPEAYRAVEYILGCGEIRDLLP